jgi:hypothetical protein
VTKHVPAEVTEEDTDAARETERETAHYRADHAQGAIEDAAAPRAMLRKGGTSDAVEDAAALDALFGKVHAADSKGRLLSSR